MAASRARRAASGQKLPTVPRRRERGPAGSPGPQAAAAQDVPTLRLTVSPTLGQQMQQAPAQLEWSDLPAELTLEFTSSAALPMDRVPVRVVAVAVREGEIVGRASTTPSLATAGEAMPVSRLACDGWPPADEWFPPSSWSPDGVRSADDTGADTPGG